MYKNENAKTEERRLKEIDCRKKNKIFKKNIIKIIVEKFSR